LRKDAAAWVSVLLVLAGALAHAAARISKLETADENKTKLIAAQGEEIKAMKEARERDKDTIGATLKIMGEKIAVIEERSAWMVKKMEKGR